MTDYVYCVKHKVTERFSDKYDSNRYYIRKGDAIRKRNRENAWNNQYPSAVEKYGIDPYELVRSELNWEVVID